MINFDGSALTSMLTGNVLSMLTGSGLTLIGVYWTHRRQKKKAAERDELRKAAEIAAAIFESHKATIPFPNSTVKAFQILRAELEKRRSN